MKLQNAQFMDESPLRSALKGFTWRLVATMTTVLIVLLITNDTVKAFQIGGIEFVAKFFVYYAHERVWLRLPYGKSVEMFNQVEESPELEKPNQKAQS